MKKLLINLIELYQDIPFRCHNNCRFIPTCSEYTKEAIETYGVFKGCIMGLKRILKCHPFGKFGYDPVKERKWKN